MFDVVVFEGPDMLAEFGGVSVLLLSCIEHCFTNIKFTLYIYIYIYIYIYYMLVSNKSCCMPSQGPNTSNYSTTDRVLHSK